MCYSLAWQLAKGLKPTLGELPREITLSKEGLFNTHREDGDPVSGRHTNIGNVRNGGSGTFCTSQGKRNSSLKNLGRPSGSLDLSTKGHSKLGSVHSHSIRGRMIGT